MQGYEKGGLRMIDISQFINALKISWFRRSITDNKDCFIIHNTMYPFYDRCLISGSDCIKYILDRIDKPFWYDIYKALYSLALTYKPTNRTEFLCSPLWCNHNLNGWSFFYKPFKNILDQYKFSYIPWYNCSL